MSMMEPKEARSGPGWWGRRSRRSKLLVIALAVLIAVLALGLGLGLGLGLNNGDDQPPPQTTAAPLPATPTNLGIWQPPVNASWQIILTKTMLVEQGASSVTPDVDIYDIDLFLTPKATIDTLHKLGKKVICYFSAGSYEPDRPDSGQFKESDMGKELKGWPKERWLNLNSKNIKNIMEKRMALAQEKGCDGVDPDNTDAYDNKNGLGMTMADSINFMHFLSTKAQQHKLAIGLKNSAAIIGSVLPGVQFSVQEQCVQFSECGSYAPFIKDNKPVFHIEYPSEVKPDFVTNFCKDSGPGSGSQGFSTVIKNYNLDGYVKYCSGLEMTTPT